MFQPNGELIPVGGGDPIPLIREVLTIGRRESCDICMRFPDISSLHAQMSFQEGYWRIRDMNSTNGIKVNGVRVLEKLLHPKDEVSIGRRRKFTIEYELPAGRRPPASRHRPHRRAAAPAPAPGRRTAGRTAVTRAARRRGRR